MRASKAEPGSWNFFLEEIPEPAQRALEHLLFVRAVDEPGLQPVERGRRIGVAGWQFIREFKRDGIHARSRRLARIGSGRRAAPRVILARIVATIFSSSTSLSPRARPTVSRFSGPPYS